MEKMDQVKSIYQKHLSAIHVGSMLPHSQPTKTEDIFHLIRS